MRHLVLRGFGILTFVAIQACATASFYVPDNRFMSPENSGALGDGFVAIGYGSKTNVIVANGDLATDDQVKNSADLTRGDGIFVQAAAGLHPVAEIFFSHGAFGAKFQLAGKPASEAETGNFSLALGLAVKNGSESTSTNLAGDLTYTLKTEARYQGTDAMILTGYRITDNQLIYANIASASYLATGSITKEYTSGNAAGTANKITIPSREVRETSLLLGWQALNSQAYVMVEGGYALASMQDTNRMDRLVFGSTIGIRW